MSGIAVTAGGAALTLAGAGLVTWGVVLPPTQNVSHGYCGNSCSPGGFYDPPLVAGGVALGLGAAAVGTGIALIVLSRHEHRSVALTGDRIDFVF